MAVDKSVLLLKSGNDITKEKVFFTKLHKVFLKKKMSKIQVETDVAQYDTTRRGIIFSSSWFLPWWPVGGEDARQIFDVRNSPYFLHVAMADRGGDG